MQKELIKNASAAFSCLFAAMLLLSFMPANAGSSVAHNINYQGYLVNSSGFPVDGTVSMTFSIYDVDTNGTALWSETQSVNIVNGVYSVVLGSVVDINLPFDVQYYLGIEIEAEGDLTPRQPLTSVGYAMRTEIADTVPSDSITEDKIADGAVSPSKLADTCNVGEILIKTSSGWGCGPSPY